VHQLTEEDLTALVTRLRNGGDGKRAWRTLTTIATLIAPALLALIGWSINRTITGLETRLDSTQENVQELTVEVALLRQDLSSLRREMSSVGDDRYRGADAQKDFKLRDAMIEDLEQRIESLEKWKNSHVEGGGT